MSTVSFLKDEKYRTEKCVSVENTLVLYESIRALTVSLVVSILYRATQYPRFEEKPIQIARSLS